MVNRYPWWKNLLIAVVVALGLLYSVPNLYPEDPAVQVSNTTAEGVDASTRDKIRQVLDDKALDPKSMGMEEGRFLIRFDDSEAQLQAKDALKDALSRNFTVALNLAPATPGWLRALGASPMSLGLDLRGGVHFLMEVDMNAVLETTLERYQGEFRTVLREADIRYLGVSRVGGGLMAKFRDAETRDRALDRLAGEYPTALELEADRSGETPVIRARLSERAAQEARRGALKQNITTLRNRVNELGVSEPVIQQQGQERIVVQLPGVQDTARAKEILGATATLEFRLVDEEHDPYRAEETGDVPAGSRLYQERNGDPILLKRRVMLTGDYIVDASSGLDQQTGGAAVFINLDSKGARLMRKASGEHVGDLMGVVFIETKTETKRKPSGELVRKTRKVEEVINVARIREQLGKRFQITGLDSTQEARNLALLLRAGSLAAPMVIVEERTVGPSLGQENIDRGFKSVIIGLVLVLVFMALYYRVFGLVADLALAVNLVLIVALLSLLPTVLTLPGIAGIVLTVGMAVDANVLIFERVREERRNGNSPQASIDSGYGKALSTIADANVTTLIAAIVLFGFGTGPIKGFAVTLSLGIVSSMFTAILGTRAVVNLIYGRRRVQQLAI